MDSVVIDLLKGPTGEDAAARIAWLKKTHNIRFTRGTFGVNSTDSRQ